MTPFRVGLALSAVVVALGVFVVSGYYFHATEGSDVPGIAAGGVIAFGGVALALIWLGVFVVIVIHKGIRVLGK